MTELERRLFLLWAAGSAFTILSAAFEKGGAAFEKSGAAFENDGLGLETLEGGAEDKEKDKDKKEVKPGEQSDGSYVLDPKNPPDIKIKTKEEPNGHFVKVGKDTVLVAQSEDKKAWYAVSAICTHKACAVSFRADDKIFRCPCHGSKFSLTGKVSKGPAKEDLVGYAATEVKGPKGAVYVRVAKAEKKK